MRECEIVRVNVITATKRHFNVSATSNLYLSQEFCRPVSEFLTINIEVGAGVRECEIVRVNVILT